MITWLTTLGVAVASALIPLVNIEVYLTGLGAIATGHAWSLAVSAGLGQTIGKVVWHQAAARTVETAWFKDKLTSPKVRKNYDKWVERMHGRPWYAAGLVLFSSFTGIPPLLVIAAVAGGLKMPLWAFVPAVLVGRVLRFWLILAGAGAVLG